MKKTLVILALLVNNAFGQTLNEVVNFETNSSALSVAEKDKVLSLILQLGSMDDYTIRVIGHTDSIGTAKFNETLSAKRASSVFKFFVDNGIKPEKVSIDYFGLTQPIASNTTETTRQKNRRVQIIVAYKKDTAIQTKADLAPKQKFENDTTLIFPGGTQLYMDAETFYPRKIKDIDFKVEEVFSSCDMLRNNIKTQTVDGDCLASGGMVLITPTIDSVEVQPNKGKKIIVKIPAPKNIIDKEMKVYHAVRKNGNVYWELAKMDVSYDLAGKKYYVFETDNLCGFNLDKPLKVKCEEDGPLVKVKKYKNVMMYLTYPGELYLSEGIHVNSNLYSLPKVNESKTPMLTVMEYKNGCAYIAKGPLLNLEKIKKNKIYLVRKEYFKPFVSEIGRAPGKEELFCESMNGQ